MKSSRENTSCYGSATETFLKFLFWNRFFKTGVCKNFHGNVSIYDKFRTSYMKEYLRYLYPVIFALKQRREIVFIKLKIWRHSSINFSQQFLCFYYYVAIMALSFCSGAIMYHIPHYIQVHTYIHLRNFFSQLVSKNSSSFLRRVYM